MKRWLPAITAIILSGWLIVLTVVFLNHRNQTLRQIQAFTRQIGPDPNAELVALKAQVQLIAEYNDDLPSTVHWSIGFASTFLLAFLGLAT